MGAQAEVGGDGDGSQSPGLSARQGGDRLASVSPACRVLRPHRPGRGKKQARGLSPSHRESRSTMFLCVTHLVVFLDPGLALVTLSFCQIDPEVPEEGFQTWGMSEMVLVLTGLAGTAVNSRGPLDSSQQPVLPIKCPMARNQALSSCLRSRLCLPPGTGSGRVMTFLSFSSPVLTRDPGPQDSGFAQHVVRH